MPSKPNRAAIMSKKKAIDPSSGKTISKQAKHIPTPIQGPSNMLNTITFSTDMDILYLIDNGRAIPYSLNTIGGVLVGVIKGQLVVVSALEQMPDKGEDDTVFSAIRERSAIPIPNVKAAKIPTERGQWTIAYIRKSQKLCIMGAVDIDSGLVAKDELSLEGYLFDLKEGFLNIQKIGSTIVIETVSNNF